jgi:hypothetical protein
VRTLTCFLRDEGCNAAIISAISSRSLHTTLTTKPNFVGPDRIGLSDDHGSRARGRGAAAPSPLILLPAGARSAIHRRTHHPYDLIPSLISLEFVSAAEHQQQYQHLGRSSSSALRGGGGGWGGGGPDVSAAEVRSAASFSSSNYYPPAPEPHHGVVYPPSIHSAVLSPSPSPAPTPPHSTHGNSSVLPPCFVSSIFCVPL